MTPKEKAEELFDRYYSLTPLDANITDSIEVVDRKIMQDRRLAVKCALIAVDEILSFMDNLIVTEGTLDYQCWYWQEVKKELEAMK